MFREEAIIQLATPKVTKSIENFLIPYSKLLNPNPRAMKRYVIEYSVNQTINNLVGEEVIDREKIALWTIMVMRWSKLAEYLEKNPNMVKYIGQDILAVDDFPEILQKFLEKYPRCVRFIGKETININTLPKYFRKFLRAHPTIKNFVLKRTIIVEDVPKDLRLLFPKREIYNVVIGKGVVGSLDPNSVRKLAGLRIRA
jgi:hypothetical protein